ncbi:MAG: glycoside hydrolase family 25 protein, partial [Ruminococcus sp.]|nr:glycoside hydrolase family 25 protein [Ruminococcus sp.]
MRLNYRQRLCLILSGVLAVSSFSYPMDTGVCLTIHASAEPADVSTAESGTEEENTEDWLEVATDVLSYYAAHSAALTTEVSAEDLVFYDVTQDGGIDLADATYFMEIYASYGAGIHFDGYIPIRNNAETSTTTTAAVTTTIETTIATAAETTKPTTTAAKSDTTTAAKTTADATTIKAAATTTTEKATTSKAAAATTTVKTTTSKAAEATTTEKTTTSKTTTKKTTTTGKTTASSAGPIRPADTTTVPEEIVTTTAGTTTTLRLPSAWGIDVSFYQGLVDWEAVKESGVDFAIVRAGYGKHLNQEDKYFDTNMKNAQAAGVDCGAYWFSYATTPEDAIREADVFYEVIKGYQFEYPIYFDYEASTQYKLTPEQSTAIIEAFCTRMQERGYYICLYSYVNFLNTRIEPEILEDYDTWIAHYNVDVPLFSYEYGMWQYSCKGKIAGIAGDVDLNYAYRDYPAIMEEYGFNTGEILPVTTTVTTDFSETTTTETVTTVSGEQGSVTTGKTTTTAGKSTTTTGETTATTGKSSTTTGKTTTTAGKSTTTTGETTATTGKS